MWNIFKTAIISATTLFLLCGSPGNVCALTKSSPASRDVGNKGNGRLLAANKTANVVMGAMLVVCAVTIANMARDNATLKRRNSVAYALIDKLTREGGGAAAAATRPDGDGGVSGKPEGGAVAADGYDEFLNVDRIVVGNRLFLQPKLTIADVAEVAGVSPLRLEELFARFSALPFGCYLNDLRMGYAATLLKEKPQYTVEAVAQECCVPVRQTFHRLFAKKFGMTPAEYRNCFASECGRRPRE